MSLLESSYAFDVSTEPYHLTSDSIHLSDLSDYTSDEETVLMNEFIENTPLPPLTEGSRRGLPDFEDTFNDNLPIGMFTFCTYTGCDRFAYIGYERCVVHEESANPEVDYSQPGEDEDSESEHEPEPEPPKLKRTSRISAYDLCAVDGCLEKVHARGHCNTHYKQLVNICRVDGCGIRVYMNGVCYKHGDVIPHKQFCKTEGCKKQAQTGGLCVSHGGTYTLCKTEGCEKQARSGGHCVKHGGKATYKRCATEGCEKHAKNGGHCVTHGGTHTMPICKVGNCSHIAKKNGLCRRHHPTHGKCRVCKYFQVPIQNGICSSCGGYRAGSFEYSLRAALKDWYPNMTFQENKIIDDSCLKYRPDFYLETKYGYALIIEVDEDEHCRYDVDCEVIRMINIQQAIGMPTIWIRYNPDVYRPDGITPSRQRGFTKMQHLRAVIESYFLLQPEFEPGVPYVQYLRYSNAREADLKQAMIEKLSVIM